MSKILAPTRGGQPSYPNQDRVIALAKEKGAELCFLYITDISFLDRVSSPVLIDIEEELDEMGLFLLAMATERAQKQDVEAQAIVRRGHFRDVLKATIKELEIEILVLGSPVGRDGLTTFEQMRGLAIEMAEFFKIEAYILASGEIAFEYQG